MKPLLRLTPFVFLLFAIGCSSKIKSISYAKRDILSFKSFACVTDSTSFRLHDYKTKSKNPIKKNLTALINRRMVEKGFIVDQKKPDMLVFLTTSEELMANKNKKKGNGIIAQGPNEPYIFFGPVSGYPRSGATAPGGKKIPLRNGSLVIEVFHRKSKDLLWIGTVKNFESHISDQSWQSVMINELFNKFPN